MILHVPDSPGCLPPPRPGSEEDRLSRERYAKAVEINRVAAGKRRRHRRQVFNSIGAGMSVPTCVGIIAWSGGYNFDHRNADVAFGVANALFIGIAVGLGVYFLSKVGDE